MLFITCNQSKKQKESHILLSYINSDPNISIFIFLHKDMLVERNVYIEERNIGQPLTTTIHPAIRWGRNFSDKCVHIIDSFY